jgi:GcrA cell cycle regulator
MTVTCRRPGSAQAQRDAEILRRWDENESSGDIANVLGVTRSVVMGVVCRAGKQRREPSKAAQREGGRKGASRLHSERRIKIRRPVLPPILAPIDFSPETPPEPEPPSNDRRKTILTISTGECHWPIGDPTSAEFFFCGDTAQPGLSYCGAHCRRAYRPKDAPRDVRPHPRTGAFR